MTHDSLDSAYAVLGLGRDTPSTALKRRYRILVKQWHPDRFVGDAKGIADATTMLKAINRAYSTIVEHRKRDFTVEPPRQSNRASPTVRRFDGHLTAQQVDDIVAAVRH